MPNYSSSKTSLTDRLRYISGDRGWQIAGAAICILLIVAGLWVVFRPGPKYQAANQSTSATPTPTSMPTPSATASPMPTPTPTATATPASSATPQPTTQAAQLKYFSPSDFVSLYYRLNFPGTQKNSTPPPIYGDTAADTYIQQMAESLGYKLQPLATADLTAIQGQQLQPAAAQAWLQLQAAARAQGISLGLISGYRSPASQRQLFEGSLHDEGTTRIGRDYTMAEIANGAADAAINSILQYRSIPGFSKHHTGYVMDLTDAGSGKDFTNFRDTAGYRWISADDYAAAKTYGFIPSYPEGAASMGPAPEAWEFIFVGKQYTYQ